MLARILAALEPQETIPMLPEPALQLTDREVSDAVALLLYAIAYEEARATFAWRTETILQRDGYLVTIGLYLTNRFRHLGFVSDHYEAVTGCAAARIGHAELSPSVAMLVERGRHRYLELAAFIARACDDDEVLAAIILRLDGDGT